MDALEQARLDAWFATQWRHGPCPVCAAESWDWARNLGQIPNMLMFGPNGGNTVPVVLINCNNCGYTLPINAVVAGILGPPPMGEPPSPPPAQGEQTGQGES
jgi:hypothetical protein